MFVINIKIWCLTSLKKYPLAANFTVDNPITVIGITVIDTYYRYHDLLVSFNADSMFTNRHTIMVSYIRFDKW